MVKDFLKKFYNKVAGTFNKTCKKDKQQILKEKVVQNAIISSFVDKFVQKETKKQKIKKIIIISLAGFVVLFTTVRFVNTCVLSYMVNKAFDEFKENDKHSATYKLSRNFIKSRVFLRDLKVSVNTGDFMAKYIVIKHRSGIFIPKELNITVDGINTISNDGTEYNIAVTEGRVDFTIKLNRHITKRPELSGFKLKKDLKLSIMSNGKNVGNFAIDDLIIRAKNVGQKNEKSFIRYKGSLIFHDADFIPSLVLMDRPFSWDIQIAEKKKTQKWGLKNENTEIVSKVKIDRFFVDYDFASMNAQGKFSYGNTLKSSKMKMKIQNYQKLLQALFNALSETKPEASKLFTNTYKVMINNIIPILKKNDNVSAKRDLVFDIFKKKDDELSINGVGADTLLREMAKISIQ